MKNNKKLLAVLSVPAIASLLAVAVTTPVKAADRDFTDNSVSPAITYSYDDYTSSDEKFDSLIDAVYAHPSNFLYEMGGKHYQYSAFFDTYSAAKKTGVTAAQAYKIALDTTPVVTLVSVTSVDTVKDVLVDNGTTADKLGLPTTVAVTLSDGTKDAANVAWDTTKFDGTKVGDQTITGTLTAPAGKAWTLTDAQKTVNVKVTVKAADTQAPTISTADSKVTDYKTLTVAFSEKVAGTPVVKVNGVAVDAANVALSEDGLSLTVTNTNGYAAGDYNVVVNGLKDVAGNAMAADASVKLTKAASQPTKVAITSTQLKAATSTVAFDVFDQYGQKLTTLDDKKVDVKAFYGTMPIGDAQNIPNTFNVSFTSTALVKDRQISVQAFVQDKDGNFTVKAGEATLGVIDTQNKATSIGSIERTDANKAKAVKAGDTVVLTANVLDQYGNKMTDLKWKDSDAADATVRSHQLTWTTSDASVVAISGTTGSFATGVADNFDETFVAKKNGTATITAYLPDGSAYKTFDVSVVDGQLADVNVDSAKTTLTNKAALDKANIGVNATDSNGTLTTSNNIVFYNGTDTNKKAIPVKAADVTFTVVAPTTAYNAADVTVEKVTDASGNLTGLKVTSNRTKLTEAETAGNYALGVDYTVKVKSNVDGVAEKTFTVTSKIDAAVASIDDVTIGSNELTAGSYVNKNLVFKNKYGETLNVKASAVGLTSSDNTNLAATTLTKAQDGSLVAATGDNVVAGVKFSPKAKGSYTVLVISGVASKTITVPVADTAKVNSVSLGAASVDVIANDAYDANSDTDDVVVVGGVAYKLVPVALADQYGNNISVCMNDLAVAYSAQSAGLPNATVLGFKGLTAKDALDNYTKGVKYIGVAVGNGTYDFTKGNGQETLKVGLASSLTGVDNLSLPSLAVNVKAPRTVKSISVDSNVSVVANGSVKKVVTLTDQYGNAITDASKVKVDIVNNDTTSTARVPAYSIAYDSTDKVIYATFTGVDKGAYTATFTSLDDANVKATANVTVGDVTAIDSIAFKDSVSGNYKNTVSTKDGVTLYYTVKDTNGSEISLAPSNLASVMVDSSMLDVAYTPDNGIKLTYKASDIETGKTKTTAVTLLTANGKTATINLTLATDAPVIDTNTLQLVDTVAGKESIDENASKDGIQVILGKDADGNANLETKKAFSVIGTDQYGITRDITNNVTFVTADSSIASVAYDSILGKEVLTVGSTEGTTTITAFYKGKLIQFEVTNVRAAQLNSASVNGKLGSVTQSVDKTSETAKFDVTGETSVQDAELNVSEDATLTLTFRGVTKSVALKAGVQTLQFKDVLPGVNDIDADGVKVSTLKGLSTDGKTVDVKATLTDKDGNVINGDILFIVAK